MGKKDNVCLPIQCTEENMALFLLKMHYLNLIVGKQQTNKNWRHSTKVIDDKTKTEELSQTVTTQCNVSFKGHCWDNWRNLNGLCGWDSDCIVSTVISWSWWLYVVRQENVLERVLFFKYIHIEVLRGNGVTYNPVTLKDHQILRKFP